MGKTIGPYSDHGGDIVMTFYADPDHEPHKVLIERDVFVDSARNNREVPFKIYYPIGHDKGALPVVIWSHGLGGSRDGAAFLGRYIASHGYVVVNIQHHGTDTSLWEGLPGHPWDNIRKAEITEEITLDRYRDVPFVLDQLVLWKEQNPDIGQFMDFTKIGMSGHSFGAITTQAMAGQKLGTGADMFSMMEERFKAAIAYSPSVTYNKDEDPHDVYGAISMPVLYMTGTQDDSPISGKDYLYRKPVFDYAGGPDQYWLVLEDADHMVFAGSRGKLGKSPKRDLHEAYIKTISLAYWDVFLKEDNGAREWINGEGIENSLSTEGHIQRRNIS